MSRTNFKFDFSASSSSFHCRRSLGLSRHFRNIIDKRFDDRASLARSRAMKKPGRKAPSRNSTMKDRTMRARLKMRAAAAEPRKKRGGGPDARLYSASLYFRSVANLRTELVGSGCGRIVRPSLSVLSYKGSSHHFAHPNAKLKPFRAQRQRASLRK